MIEILLAIVLSILATIFAAIGLGRVNKTDDSKQDLYREMFLQEIEKRSPQMGKIIYNKTRKLNETEEGWICDVLKEKYGESEPDAIKYFKENILDPMTEKPDYGKRTPRSRKYTSENELRNLRRQESAKDAYARAQNELYEIEEMVIKGRKEYAKSNLPYPPKIEERPDIDVVQDSEGFIEKKRDIKLKEKYNEIKKHPYKDLNKEEVRTIKSRIREAISNGLVSKEIGTTYKRKINKFAGIRKSEKISKNERERQKNIEKSTNVYRSREINKKNKALQEEGEREDYVRMRAKKRKEKESENEKWYRKVINAFR